MKTPDHQLERATDTPNLKELKEELETAMSDSRDFNDRAASAFDTRFALWANQTADGRKHSTNSFAAFPWENCSDTRIRLADMLVNERKELLLLSLRNATYQATAADAKNAEWGNRMSTLLRYYLHGPCAEETDAELELLADWMLTFGSAVLAVDWCQVKAWEPVTLTMDMLFEGVSKKTDAEDAVQRLEIFQDPTRELYAVEIVKQFSEWITDAQAAKIVRDLREGKEVTFDRPYEKESRPALCALQTFQDVYFPAGTDRLQRARWVARRELLTASELEQKAEGAGWDEVFVEKVLEIGRGKMWQVNDTASDLRARARNLGLAGWFGRHTEDTEDLFEVWHFTYKASKRGLPAIFHTVMHPMVEKHGLHEVLPYNHGDMPFVEFTLERNGRSILASRGIPERVDTHQREVKVQRDARVDRSNLTVLPPVLVKRNRATPTNLAFGPAAQIPVNNTTDIRFMDQPGYDMTSIEVERATKADVNEYFGRRADGVPQSLIDLNEQGCVSRWLKGWTRSGRQMLQLAQQFTPEFTLARVAGLIPRPFEVSREAIEGQFDLTIEYDARFSNQEFVFGLLERIQKFLVPLDSNATIDRDALIRWAFSAINPTLADQVVRDPEAAHQSEIMDELDNVVRMVGGVEPPMKMGQNYRARMEVLNTQLRSNPLYMALAQSRPDFGQMLQRREEFLQQQIDQEANKQIGIFGTQPSATNALIDGRPAELVG